MLRYRFIFYVFSGTLILASIGSLAFLGLPLNHEFLGGSVLAVEFEKGAPSAEAIRAALRDLTVGPLAVESPDRSTRILRFSAVEEPTHQKLVAQLRLLGGGAVRERRFETFGPTLGRELGLRSALALGFSLVGIFIYLAATFRKSTPIARPSLFAALGVVTLIHDVVIAAGLLSLFTWFRPLEVGAPVVAAFLVIVGYSINDTIIVFDRIREAGRFAKDVRNTAPLIGGAITGTLRRSLFTSLTTLLAVAAIFFFGGESLKAFAFTLLGGIAVGTYSSLCIASPLLYDLAKK